MLRDIVAVIGMTLLVSGLWMIGPAYAMVGAGLVLLSVAVAGALRHGDT